MKTVKLQVQEDIATGELGLTVKAMKMIDTPMVANEGLLIAHDLLEHQNGVKNIGSIDDELEALGGVWYIRGLSNKMRKGSSATAYDTLPYDICSLGEIYMHGVNFRTPVPNTRALDYDYEFGHIISSGIKKLREELDYCEMTIDEVRLKAYEDACLHYMRRGFRKANRRYAGVYEASSMFWNVSNAVDTIIDLVDYEGQEFILRYDHNQAYCNEYYDYE